MALRLARLQRAIASRHLTPKPTPKYSSTQIGHTPIALSTAMLGRFTISTKSVAALAALGAWNQIRTIATVRCSIIYFVGMISVYTKLRTQILREEIHSGHTENALIID